MNKKRRRWVSIFSGIILTCVFVLLSGIAIVWAGGFKFDPKTGSFEQTAIIAVDDTIDNVSVTLNGNEVATSTPYQARNLQPGWYTVEISRAGFVPYRRVFELQAGQAGVVKNVVLVASNPLVTELQTPATYTPADAFDAGLTFTSGELLDYSRLISRFSTDIIQAHRYQNGYMYQTGKELRFFSPRNSQDYLVYSAASADLLPVKLLPNDWAVVVFTPDKQLLVDLSRPSEAAAN